LWAEPLRRRRRAVNLPHMKLPAETEWIADPAHLRERLSAVGGRVGLDTEFIRERTWWPHLALVQIALERPGAPPAIVLADTQAPGIAEALRPLLADPSVIKIMHSAGEDLIALERACGVPPAPVFDTQTAAALAGIGAGMGYQRLVAERLGIVIDKGETRSDWTRRPLSDAQLGYAAEDVRHLFALHDALHERLHALERLAWLEEDCARQLTVHAEQNGERWPHLALLRRARVPDRAAQLRLLRLTRWRDAFARDHDRPRNWILHNDLALQLATTPARTLADLQRQLDAWPKAPRKLAAVIWNALVTPLDDEDELPPLQSAEPDKPALRRLQQAVAARSTELGLPEGVLASRRALLALLDGPGWPAALDGWRRTELEPLLVPLLPRPHETIATTLR